MMEYETDGETLGRPDEAGTTEEIERLIEEAEAAIRNTRSFLDHLRSSEEGARELVGSIQERFEKDLEVLQRRNVTESAT